MYSAIRDEVKRIAAEVYAEMKEAEEATKVIEKPKEERLYTSKETAKMLRVTPVTLHRWKSEGLIPHIRIGNNIRYKETDIEKMLQQKSRG